ncbi:MAG: hypothetical protein QXZ70_08360 [Candidatus Bathyarchaeia archaeon]
MVFITKTEAARLLGMDMKQFNNFYSKGAEFEQIGLDREKLLEWKKDYDLRCFMLSPEEYAKCLDFALAMHFRGYASIDFGTARQREFGQKVSNWVRGQLGELGFAHFCRERLGFDIELDFAMHEEIVPQDVLAIIQNGQRKPPTNRIAVKATKYTNVSLVLSRNEVELPTRLSDVYVFTRLDLPDDHLLRVGRQEIINLLQNQEHFHLYKDRIESLGPIKCEVAGFAYRTDLKLTDSIPGYKFESERYCLQTGKLRRVIEEWKQAIR